MRLSELQRMDPIEFEQYVGRLFRKMGYRVEDTRASADEGIDLILRRGRKRAVVQCKRYQGSVGQPVVRDLFGVLLHTGSAEAYLVTTGTITRQARSWAEDKPIHLVDGHRMVEWIRTGRLNYDKKPVLGRTRRGRTLALLGAALLLVLALYTVRAPGDGPVRGWLQTVFTRIEDSRPPTPPPVLETPTSAPAASATEPANGAATPAATEPITPTALPTRTPTATPILSDPIPSTRTR